MPIYEYVCRGCGAEFQHLVLKKEDEDNLICPNCKGRELKKLVSRTEFHFSEQDRLDRLDPHAKKGADFYKDTRNIGLNAKKRAQQMGVDLGTDFDSKLDGLRTDPGKILDDTE